MSEIQEFEIVRVASDKRRFLPLLLLGDESEAMIDRYLDHGVLYVAMRGTSALAVCVTLDLDENTVEVKNLAVRPDCQRQGIGRRMLMHVETVNSGKKIFLGTGETPSTLHFYHSCGYVYSHRIPGFFTENYPLPIVEEGVTLCDMIYLKKG